MITPEVRARLAEFMDERRLELRLTWREVAEAGEVSYEAVRAARNGTQDIRPLTQAGIEKGLHWERGSISLILAGGYPQPVQSSSSHGEEMQESLPGVPPDSVTGLPPRDFPLLREAIAELEAAGPEGVLLRSDVELERDLGMDPRNRAEEMVWVSGDLRESEKRIWVAYLRLREKRTTEQDNDRRNTGLTLALVRSNSARRLRPGYDPGNRLLSCCPRCRQYIRTSRRAACRWGDPRAVNVTHVKEEAPGGQSGGPTMPSSAVPADPGEVPGEDVTARLDAAAAMCWAVAAELRGRPEAERAVLELINVAGQLADTRIAVEKKAAQDVMLASLGQSTAPLERPAAGSTEPLPAVVPHRKKVKHADRHLRLLGLGGIGALVVKTETARRTAKLVLGSGVAASTVAAVSVNAVQDEPYQQHLPATAPAAVTHATPPASPVRVVTVPAPKGRHHRGRGVQVPVLAAPTPEPAATPSPVPSSTSPSPAQTPAVRGVLAVQEDHLTVGPGRTALLTFAAEGGGVVWSASSSDPGVHLSQDHGGLADGQAAEVTVTVDPSLLLTAGSGWVEVNGQRVEVRWG
jgi:hypothetical protein